MSCASGESCDCGGQCGKPIDDNHPDLLVTWDPHKSCWQHPEGHDEPNSGMHNQAYGGEFKVFMAPIHLYWNGLVTDRILQSARLLMDQARWYRAMPSTSSSKLHDEGASDLGAARRMAAYASGILRHFGGRLIHEIGHTWMGGGHCRHECCFDKARLFWECHVSARDGMPWNTYTSPDDEGEEVGLPSAEGRTDRKGRCGTMKANQESYSEQCSVSHYMEWWSPWAYQAQRGCNSNAGWGEAHQGMFYRFHAPDHMAERGEEIRETRRQRPNFSAALRSALRPPLDRDSIPLAPGPWIPSWLP